MAPDNVRMGLFRRTTAFITRPYRQMAEVARDSAANIIRSWQDLSDPHAKVERKRRRERMARDFEAVKQIWGFTDAQIPQVVRGLKIESTFYAALAAAGFFSAVLFAGASPVYFLSSGCLMVIGTIPAVTGYWRASVIEQRQYCPLIDWITGRKRSH